MKSTVENLETTKVKITVEVPYEELSADMDRSYREIAKQVRIPGWRPGKASPQIIDQRIGRVAVIEQTVNEVLPRLYTEAIRENALRVMAQPDVEVTEIPNTTGERGGQLVFTAEVSIVPEFTLPDTDGIELTVDPITVEDKDIDEELDALRTRFASLKPVKRKAKKGDFVTIDMVARIDGNDVESVSDTSYEIGSGTMLDGMDKALTGVKTGEEVVFTSTLVGGEHEGEEAEITINVTAVKGRDLPKADDDFAQMVSEFDTIDELRDDLKTQVSERKTADQALQARDRFLDALREGANIELPADVVNAEVEARVGEKPTKKQRTEAEDAVRTQLANTLILDELAKAREPKISQQELFEFMMQTARMYGQDPSTLFQDQQQIQMMVGELTRSKALALTLADVTVKDTEGNEVDLSRFTADPAEEEPEDEATGASAVEDGDESEGESED